MEIDKKSDYMNNTGIALFVYNRPDHTIEVLDGLKKNELDELFIFSDGEKNSEDKSKVSEVRNIIDSLDFCRTEIIKRNNNLGLAESIVSGVNYVLKRKDRIIVLEDDCIPSPNFVVFMKKILEMYKNNSRVMAVSGYAPPINIPQNYQYDIYFSPRFISWGWGTYKKAWKHFKQDMNYNKKIKKNKKLKRKIKNAGDDLFLMLKKRLNRENDSWAVFWALNIIEKNGVCINPVDSMIKNIGFDTTGTHTRCGDKKNVNLNYRNKSNMESLKVPPKIEINNTILKRLKRYHDINFGIKIKIKIKNLLKRLGII